MFQDACFVDTSKRLGDGTIKRTLLEGAFPTLSGKHASTAEQKKSEDGREAREAKKKKQLETLEEKQRARAAQVQEEAAKVAAQVQEEAAKVQEKAQKAEAAAKKVTMLQLLEKFREARERAKKLDPDSVAGILKEAQAAFVDNPESIAHLLNSVDFTQPNENFEKVCHCILVYFLSIRRVIAIKITILP